MSKKKDNQKRGESKVDRLKAELAELEPWELWDLLACEFDRRRLDQDGNPTDPPGLYTAAMVSMTALIGEDVMPEHVKMVGKLAAVGRGVQVRTLGAEDAPMVREIAELVEAIHKSKSFAPAQRPQVLAFTLAKRFGRPVTAEQMKKALSRRSRNGRIADAALAASVITPKRAAPPDEVRRDALRRVALALKDQ